MSYSLDDERRIRKLCGFDYLGWKYEKEVIHKGDLVTDDLYALGSVAVDGAVRVGNIDFRYSKSKDEFVLPRRYSQNYDLLYNTIIQYSYDHFSDKLMELISSM